MHLISSDMLSLIICSKYVVLSVSSSAYFLDEMGVSL